MNTLTFRHEAMATYFEVIIADQEPAYARQAATAFFREVDRLVRNIEVTTQDVVPPAFPETLQVRKKVFQEPEFRGLALRTR